MMPPNQRITTTTTRSKSCPSMAVSIGRPAVPPGSPSSLKRYWLPIFQAQQLCVAVGSLTAWMKACASSAVEIGAAVARKRLLLMTSSSSQGALRVKGMAGTALGGE
ncbi:hypothetical protein D3C77_585820 [compost metagenome]